MDTKESLVIVTGAGGKLGSVISLGFAELGYGLVLVGRNIENLVHLREKCELAGAPFVLCISVDLTESGAIEHVIHQLEFNGLNPRILVNNARCLDYLKIDTPGYMSRKNWMGEFLLDVIVPFELTSSILDNSISNLSSVINISSIYGINAPNLRLYDDYMKESPINYGVVKAAQIHLTKELSVRYASRSVRVNSVSFGGVDGRVSSDFRERYSTLCPMGRMLSTNDIFGPIKFLATSDSSGVTGHNLVVDGGWTAW